MPFILAIDQGTTSSRALLLDHDASVLASAQREFPQYYPQPGWVEHDALEIWESVLDTCREVLKKAGVSISDIVAIGITNQRETTLLWDRSSGEPLHRAIVWQDRRTAPDTARLHADGREDLVRKTTGLVLDPYFSASKIAWLLRESPGLADRAAAGEIAAGTIDTWLVWKLSMGRSHITDVSNASRTMLMDLRTCQWSGDMLRIFDIPEEILPRIVSNNGALAECDASWFGCEIPICGIAGDQQAALFGQLCIEQGNVKCTYGTGCFLLMNTGHDPVASQHRLLGTVAWRLDHSKTVYAIEGSVFTGGAAIQWLRDGLKIIDSAPAVNVLAESVPDNGGVVLVPAFTGLGAPHWDPNARGILAGITRGVTGGHIARATLESIALQVGDLIHAMEEDSGTPIRTLRVDGGAAASDLLMEIQAGLLDTPVERPENLESTAIGAAFLAGLGCGFWSDIDELLAIRRTDRIFKPEMSQETRSALITTWRRALERSKSWETP